MNFVRKNKTSIILLLSIMIISTLGFSIISYGDENDNLTITQTEYDSGKSMADAFGKCLKYTDIVQNHKDHLTVDSSGYEPEPAVKEGEKVNSQIRYEEVPTINGEKVTDFTITLARSEHLTTEDVAKRMAERFGDGTEKGYKDVINSDPLFANGFAYGYLANIGSEITIKVTINSKGEAIYEIPKEFSDGVYVFKTITINGEEIEIGKFDRVYVRKGEVEDPITPGPQPTIDPEPEENDSHRWANVAISTKKYEHKEPSRNGSISSNLYNVTEAIPTSENLNFSATADDSLYSITERKYVGTAGVRDITLVATARYIVPCTCTKRVEVEDEDGEIKVEYRPLNHSWGTHTRTVSKEEKGFTYTAPEKIYYDVPTSNIYPVINAIISGAPVDGSVSIGLTGGPVVGPQTIKVNKTLPAVNEVEYGSGGTYNSRAAAEASLYPTIQSIKGRIMGACDRAITQTGSCNYQYRGLVVTTKSTNSHKPDIVKTSNGTTKMIPSTKANGNYPTNGAVNYSGIPFVMEVNSVFVHTPVVNNASITYIEPFINQKINIDNTRKYLQLDKSFTITIPNEGQHRNSKGYMARLYNSYQAVTKLITNWGKIKDVQLSFDVYLHEGNSRTMIKAGTWLSSLGKATTEGKYTFTIPVWAQEGNGTIKTRVVAENGSINSPSQEGANLDPNNYIATKDINVEIVGKIYDLRISSTNDPGWQNIKGQNGNYITAKEFAFGQLGQNAVNGYKYAPKLGYTIAFDFKTKGIKSNNVNVSIQPEGFYFVSKSGGKAERVDLYYNTTKQKYIKISTGDKTNIPVITNLTSPFMKVSKQELIDSVRIMNNKLGAGYNYSSNVNIGYFPRLSMPENLRLCYNNLTEYVGNGLYKKNEAAIISDATNGFAYNTRWSVLKDAANGKDVVLGAVGHWYAGYKLPASTVAVPQGKTSSDIINNPNIIKKDGYILVKFNIRTSYDKWEYLEYKGPESLNEGKAELTPEWPGKVVTPGVTPLEPTTPTKLPNGKNADIPVGIVGIFETDYRSSNDYETEGTH